MQDGQGRKQRDQVESSCHNPGMRRRRQHGGGERPPDSKRILKVKNTGFSDIPAVSYKRKRCFIDDSEFGLRQKKRLQLP